MTLLVAAALFHLQILKADNIPDLSTYYTSLLHSYIAENIRKARPANNTSAHCMYMYVLFFFSTVLCLDDITYKLWFTIDFKIHLYKKQL